MILWEKDLKNVCQIFEAKLNENWSKQSYVNNTDPTSMFGDFPSGWQYNVKNKTKLDSYVVTKYDGVCKRHSEAQKASTKAMASNQYKTNQQLSIQSQWCCMLFYIFTTVAVCIVARSIFLSIYLDVQDVLPCDVPLGYAWFLGIVVDNVIITVSLSGPVSLSDPWMIHFVLFLCCHQKIVWYPYLIVEILEEFVLQEVIIVKSSFCSIIVNFTGMDNRSCIVDLMEMDILQLCYENIDPHITINQRV
ncbi:hypothetical protein EDD18DRAFT_1107759 [Armillaria luteobubalina]|uniref:Uncharacterized protein n=1 Tax=Armillaria luteobubalina TaxID=153913 RepID=A0AA39Q1R6_9AGAR|nr:hypothetical protein EDD18DRAFT_1107759 [Armillaria luteobubalina]